VTLSTPPNALGKQEVKETLLSSSQLSKIEIAINEDPEIFHLFLEFLYSDRLEGNF
jgi:hypothetical protein